MSYSKYDLNAKIASLQAQINNTIPVINSKISSLQVPANTDELVVVDTIIVADTYPAPTATTTITPSIINLVNTLNNNTLDAQKWTGNIQTQNTSSNLTHYLNFSNSSSTGYGHPQKNASLSCNPSTGLLTSSQLTLNTPTAISTTDTPYGLYINSAGIKTYPTTANFTAYPLYKLTAELGTSQTIDGTTPGGFNFIIGDNRSYTKSAGTTSDIDRLYFNGFAQSFGWTDANTCKQYQGITDSFVYSGKNANSRTSSFFSADAITLSCPSSSTQTIANINAKTSLRITATNANATYTITSSVAPSLNFSGSGANVIANITNHSFFENNSGWDSTWSGAGSLATITNMYGLRLNPPNGGTTTGLTITNNWGIYSGWSSAKNYFAGGVGIGTTTITNALDVVGNASISVSLQVPQIMINSLTQDDPITTANLVMNNANRLNMTYGDNTRQIDIFNDKTAEPYINIVGSGAYKSLYEPTQIGFYEGSTPLSSLNATTLNFTDSVTFSASNISSSDGDLLCEGGGTAILKGYNDAILWSSDGSVELRPNDVIGDLILTGTNIESATSGGNSGQHLRIKLNGTYYKIRLEND